MNNMEKGKIVKYKIGDMFGYGLPMLVGENITTFEGYGLSIQYNIVEKGNKKIIEIVCIDSLKPGTGMFETLLGEFVEEFKEYDIYAINVINKGIEKYLDAKKIKYE